MLLIFHLIAISKNIEQNIFSEFVDEQREAKIQKKSFTFQRHFFVVVCHRIRALTKTFFSRPFVRLNEKSSARELTMMAFPFGFFADFFSIRH